MDRRKVVAKLRPYAEIVEELTMDHHKEAEQELIDNGFYHPNWHKKLSTERRA